jgi:uncharacterized cupin superfamily protein
MDSVNVFTAEIEYDDADPDGYRSGIARVGRAAGGVANHVKLYEMPAGQSLCPYHYEYAEEWMLLLEGSLHLRAPDGERPLTRGDLVCFPVGPAGAHKLTNRSDSPARLLMFSDAREPAVAVYPDSDKIGVWPGSDVDAVLLKRADGSVDYYDGEL